VRFVFDENTPSAVARALRILAEADGRGVPDPVEVLHATEVVARGTHDIPLIQAITDGAHAKTVLVTTDKSMRTRSHERAAFVETGCIGIILRTQWNCGGAGFLDSGIS
jgi:PIN like domain